ncbi:MAG: hypothetical protein CVU43_10960 [Chloroflexi bacterium HGW-Chloroflexi-5]|jgi:DNA-binding NarL/FixJ family response regulator/REP element-mobilizing transposase RayT|nr:MAG: hypothetical protein CVU43_10960 [Chloroflexi bacterium HGW-Chloroflexi-5]
MHRVILVVSPDTEFLQQLRSHLEEGGRYQVSVALSAHEALNLANSNFFEVAIVDGELDDIPVAAFTRDLTALQSDLKILVFPPDNNPQHPVLDGVAINGFLTKPFSGQEIGKALSSLFSDQPIPNNLQVKEVDDLVKQWLQIPETGGEKAEQILKATSAQTILIIIKDQVIASAGPMDDGLMTNVTGFLSRYWKDEDNSELARYIKLDGDSRDQFIYATKLVSNLVLVMVYPMKATIQLVRRELNIVKDDFQKQYPTTSEIKQDLAKYVLAGINARNKVLETLQKDSNTFSQDDIDALGQLNQQTDNTGAISQVELEARKLFEQESLISKPKPTINAISQEEIDLLKALQNEPSQPSVESVTQAELEARKLFEQESVKPKPMIAGISQEEIDLLKAMQNAPAQPAVNAVSQAELEARKLFEQESVKPKPMIAGISQEEIDLLKAMQNAPAQPAANAVSQAELEARKLFEQESVKPKPMIAGISQEEIDLLKAMQNAPAQPAVNAVSQAELEARKLFEQESLNKTIVTSNDVSQVELDALNLAQHKSTTPVSVNPSNISEQELSQLSKLLEQMPAPDPQSEGETAVEEKKLPEWLNELETAENITQSSVAHSAEHMVTPESTPVGISPFLGIDENLKTSLEKGEPLPEIDFTLPWEIEETTAQAVAEITANQTIVVKTDDTLKPEIEQPVALVEPVEEAAVEALQPTPTSFAEVLNAVAPQVETAPTTVESAASPTPESVVMEEPATPPAPPSLKDFRFNYTLVLLPGDRNQFLTKNLSDKLSAIMPDIHEDQGWKMTSITVRPQYLLWTVAVSMGICPNQILNEVRNLTSNAIFAAFAEIAKTKTSNDFWSPEYLAVSGSEPAPANLVFDFVKTAWKTPETITA